MRIENLTQTQSTTTARVEATAVWEDSDRPTRTIFFETDAAFANDLTCTPHAFLLACCLPALRHGEERVAIEETICPELRNGLSTALDLVREWWYPKQYSRLRIEAKAGIRPPLPRAAERAGAFLSGGVDSLALLRCNRLDFPADHPNSIRDCLIVHGFDIGSFDGTDWQTETFECAVASVSAATQDAQVVPIPVRTNVRHLDNDVNFWMHEFHGAALAAVAHAFSKRLSKAYIASSHYGPSDMIPWGSHPLLDPQYSSTELRILHEGSRLSRLDKIRILADWDIALQNLRVCVANTPGVLNCGKCEKCIRTMTELVAIGKLNSTLAFPTQDVTASLLNSAAISDEDLESMYLELLDPLKAIRRLDLVEVIQCKSAELHKRLAWEQEKDWKGALKRFDRKFLNSGMYLTYKSLRHRVKQGSKLH